MKDVTEEFAPQGIVRASFWALGTKIVAMAAGLVSTILIARMLSPEAIGAYFVILSMVSLLGIAAQLGLREASIPTIGSHLARGEIHEAKTIAASSFLLVLLATTIAAIALAGPLGSWVALHVFHSELLASVRWGIALLFVAFNVRILSAELFRAFGDIRTASIVSEGAYPILLCFLLLPLVLIAISVPLSNFLLLPIGANAAILLMAVVLLWRRLAPSRKTAVPSGALLRVGWPFLLTALTAALLPEAGTLILSSVGGEHEVALYGAAFRLSGVLAVPLLVTDAVAPPLITQLFTLEKRAELESLLQGMATMATLATTAGAVLLVAFGDDFLRLLFGNFYVAATPALYFLVVGQFFLVATGPCGLLLKLTGHQVQALRITALSALVLILVLPFAAKAAGGSGVAVAFSAVLGVQNLWLLIAARRLVGVKTHSRWSASGISSTVRQAGNAIRRSNRKK